jgi:hypothetical protein
MAGHEASGAKGRIRTERFWQERLGAAPAIDLGLFDIHMQRELDRHFRGDLTRRSKSVL